SALTESGVDARTAFPFTLAEFKAALNSSLAIGVTIQDGPASAAEIEPVVVGVARLPSAEMAASVGRAVLSAKQSAGSKRAPTVATVRGVRVTTFPDPSPKNAFAFAVVDSTFVFGTPKGVVSMLGAAGG